MASELDVDAALRVPFAPAIDRHIEVGYPLVVIHRSEIYGPSESRLADTLTWQIRQSISFAYDGILSTMTWPG